MLTAWIGSEESLDDKKRFDNDENWNKNINPTKHKKVFFLFFMSVFYQTCYY